MSEGILSQLQELIEHKMGKYPFEINRSTSMEKDLGITGDDAVEFLLSYSRQFQVDISYLTIDRYFTPEGDTLLNCIIRFFTSQKEPKDSELTIEHLLRGIATKRLDDQIINK